MRLALAKVSHTRSSSDALQPSPSDEARTYCNEDTVDQSTDPHVPFCMTSAANSVANDMHVVASLEEIERRVVDARVRLDATQHHLIRAPRLETFLEQQI